MVSGAHPVRSSAERDGIIDLVHRVEAADGFRPLSDQAWLDLVDGRADGVGLFDHDRVVGWAQLTLDEAAGETVVETVAEGDQASRTATVTTLLDAVTAERPGVPLRWWAFAAGDWSDVIAARLDLAATRDLLQLRITLPAAATDIDTRPFRVGADEQAWLEVNAAAFAGHPEQGRWSLDDLRRREREPWFDPDGFLLHERDGRLAAFCWTKVHHRPDGRREGEIYVIAAHPDFHGLGLGRALTLAGLQWLAGQGITDGMLFVDAGNDAAVSLYRSIGFTTARTDRTYRSCPIVTAPAEEDPP